MAEVTSNRHISSNGRLNLGFFRLHIGLVGAVEADGTQGRKLSDFLELAHKTLAEMCSNRPAEFPVVATDAESDTTIEVYLDCQSTPTTALRKDNPRLAVVAEWFEPVGGSAPLATQAASTPQEAR